MNRHTFLALLFGGFTAALMELRANGDGTRANNAIIQELLSHGVMLASGERIPLPAPLFTRNQSRDDQRRLIDKVTQKIPRDEFVRNSIVAPFVLQIETIHGTQENERAAQKVSLWFVAYGKLQTVRDEELLSNLIGSAKHSEQNPDATAEILQPDELRQRRLSTKAAENQREWFVRFTAPLLDRVQVQGVWHIEETSSPQSVLLASNLDPRFAKDRDFPNQWRTIHQDEFGKTVHGAAQSYAGWGGYAQATPLQEKPNAMIVECYMVFSEPAGWFSGTNQLRAKLPIVVQDNVRKFRRQLQQAERSR